MSTQICPRLLLFLLFPKMNGCVKSERVKDGWAVHTGADVGIFCETSSRLDRCLPDYEIYWTSTQNLVVTPPAYRLHVSHGHAWFLHATDTNSCGYTSSLPPTRFTWTCLILACHRHKFLWLHLQSTAYTFHMDMPDSCMPPSQILVVTPPAYCLHVSHGHAWFLHATYTNSCGYTSSLPPTQCTWSRFLLACHPRNLRSISAENTSVLFT